MSSSFTKNCKVYVLKKPTVAETAPQEKIEEAPKQSTPIKMAQGAQVTHNKRPPRKFYQVKKQSNNPPGKSTSADQIGEEEQGQNYKLDSQNMKIQSQISFSDEKPRVSTATTKEKSDEYMESDEENHDVDQKLEHKFGRESQKITSGVVSEQSLKPEERSPVMKEVEKDGEDMPIWADDDPEVIKENTRQLQSGSMFGIPLKLKEQLSENEQMKRDLNSSLRYGSFMSFDSNNEGEQGPPEILSTKDSSELRHEMNSCPNIDGNSPKKTSQGVTAKKNFKKANPVLFAPVPQDPKEAYQGARNENKTMSYTTKPTQPSQSLQSQRTQAAHMRPVPQKVNVKPDYKMIFTQLKQKLGLEVRPFHILSSKTTHNSWYYVDQQGIVQGPFESSDMDLWYFEEYFKDDLLISFPDRNNFRPLTYYLDLSIKITDQFYQSRLAQNEHGHRSVINPQFGVVANKNPIVNTPQNYVDRVNFHPPSKDLTSPLHIERRSDSLPIDLQMSLGGPTYERGQISLQHGLNGQSTKSASYTEVSYFNFMFGRESFGANSNEMQRGFTPLPSKDLHL